MTEADRVDRSAAILSIRKEAANCQCIECFQKRVILAELDRTRKELSEARALVERGVVILRTVGGLSPAAWTRAARRYLEGT